MIGECTEDNRNKCININLFKSKKFTTNLHIVSIIHLEPLFLDLFLIISAKILYMKKAVIVFMAILLNCPAFSQRTEPAPDQDFLRIYEVYNYVKRFYVDTVDTKKMSENAIYAMLKQLDPHTVYIPADEVERANQDINGSFVGVGIRFNILNDTLLVVNTIPGGPSEKVGIRAGDKIIVVDKDTIAGIGLKNSGVRERLLGDKGTKVNVTVLRNKKTIHYTITRDKIPLNSVVCAYMVDDKVGYIKLTSYSRTTPQEINDAIKKLKKEGMKDLIFDLEGNGGGLLYSAKKVVDEFLDDDKLIVYSKGRTQPKRVLLADEKGEFEKGRLVILINEGTASASEITTGAIQDWDRGLVVGRRSFGKGLVQRPIQLSDGAQLRLTIARFYTPSGRWIQKPYNDREAYFRDYIHRYKDGELMHRDSIHLPDSLIHYTLQNHRPVYGGGGIVPDVFVPLDTMEYSTMYKELSRSGIFYSYSLEYVNKNRERLTKKYKGVNDFNKHFTIDQNFLDAFFDYALKEDSIQYNADDFKISKHVIEVRLKADIAQDLWGIGAFYRIYNPQENETFKRAYKALYDGTYKKMKFHD